MQLHDLSVVANLKLGRVCYAVISAEVYRMPRQPSGSIAARDAETVIVEHNMPGCWYVYDTHGNFAAGFEDLPETVGQVAARCAFEYARRLDRKGKK